MKTQASVGMGIKAVIIKIAITVALLAVSGSAMAQTVTNVVYQTGFEYPAFSPGPILGQAGWVTTGGRKSQTVIETSVVESGLQAVGAFPDGTTNSVGASMNLSYDATNQILRFSIDALLSEGTTNNFWTPIHTYWPGTGLFQWIDVNVDNTNGQIHVFIVGTDYTNGVYVTYGWWNHYELDVNFTNNTVSAFYNSAPLVQNVPFSPSGTTLEADSFYSQAWSSTDAGYFDNVSVIAIGIPPTIKKQPTDESVHAGDDATFTVTAKGTPPLAYKWMFNGGRLRDDDHISGSSTASLTISSATTNDAGSYYVIVTNAFGSTNSTAATLTIEVAPTVTSITTPYSPNGQVLYFMDGTSFPVTFTADVDWSGNPPWEVRFMTPKGGSPDVPAGGSEVSQEFDVGSAFGPGGQLQVQAFNVYGLSSPSVVPNMVVMKALSNVTFGVVAQGGYYSYQSVAPVKFTFLNDGLPPGVNIDSSIPSFGGNNVLLSFLPYLDVSVMGNHAAFQFSGNDMPTLGLAGKQFTFTRELSAYGDYDGAASQWNWGGYLSLGADVDVSMTWPFVVPVFVVPVPVFLKLGLNLSAASTLNVQNLYPVELNGELAVVAQISSGAGLGINMVVSGAIWLKGAGAFTFYYPVTPGTTALQSYDIHVTAGVEGYLLGFGGQPQFFSWIWPSGSGSPDVLSQLSGINAGSLRPYPRDYLSRGSYGLFNAHQNGGMDAAGPKPADVQNGSAYALQSQVFPYSDPAIAASGTNCYAVWLYDNPSRSINNQTMLVFSRFDGTNWSAFAPVADDGTADFHPQLRVFADGTAVVAWENEAVVQSTNATLGDMTTNLGIATAFYDPAAGQWQPMQSLAANGYLNRSPRIAGPSATNLMVIWTGNPANDLEGSATDVNQLWFSTWNGSRWSAGQMFASVPYPLLWYDLSYDGTNASVVMTLDSDNTLTNVNAHELFAVSYKDGAWGGLQQLTSDPVPNDNPQMAIDPNGHIVLVWLQGGVMSSVTDFNFANQTVISTNEYSGNLADFKLASGSGGQLAVVWAEPSDNASDLWVMFYDPVFDVWGGAKQLTDDPETEMETAATFYRTNQLVALYDRIDLDTSGNQTGSLITNADLYVLPYQITNDLALVSNSLTVSPANPAPGQTAVLQVTVENLGDSGVSNVLVAFYQGNPASGETVIGQTNLALVLAPGATSTAGISWTVPATTNALSVYAVVDPNQQFPDSNPLNNEVSATFVEPDLAVQSLTWVQISNNLLSVTATVVNEGTIPSQPATVSFLLNSLTGSTLFSTNIAGLAPAQSIAVNFLWSVTNLGTGVSLFAVVNPGTGALDFNAQDNALELTIQTNITQVNVQLGQVLLLPGGAVQIGVTGLAGQTYPIQVSTNLVNWDSLTNMTLTNLSGAFIDPSATTFNRRFYRAVVP